MYKRVFDIVVSFVGLLFVPPFLLIFLMLSAIETYSNGLFLESRIGQYSKPFFIYKLRTMHFQTQSISAIGLFFRKWKLDELPQLFNVLKGDMSIVGLRPDIASYYDFLEGEERKILELKLISTSISTLKFTKEE